MLTYNLQKNKTKIAIFIILFYSLFYYSWLIWFTGDEKVKLVVGAILSHLGPLLAAVFVYMNLKRFQGRKRTCWNLLLFSCIGNFLSDIVTKFHVAYWPTGIKYAFPGWGDFLWVISLILYALFLLYTVYEKRAKYQLLYLSIDTFIIMSVFTTISWVFILEKIVFEKNYTYLKMFVSLGYAIGDLGVLLGGILLYLSYRKNFVPCVLFLNLTGLIINQIADAFFLYHMISGTYQFFTLVEPTWAISVLLIGLSSFFETESFEINKENANPSSRGVLKIGQVLLPYISTLLLILLAIVKDSELFSISVGGIVVLFLIVIRQIITILENQTLVNQLQQINLTLENKVRERTIEISLKNKELNDLNLGLEEKVKRRTKELEIIKQKLSESEQRYRSLFQNHPDLIFLFNFQGNSFALNHAADKFLLANGETQVFDSIDPSKDQYFQKAISGEPQYFEKSIYLHDTQKINFQITFVPVMIDQKIVGVFGIYRDITQQRKTEELLRRSEKLSVVSQLAASVAHEIRNPLTSIQGFLKLMEEGIIKKHFTEIIFSELERINFILNEFLTLAKPHQDTNFRETDITKVLNKVIKLMETHANLHGIEIYTQIGTDIPLIECEENQIIQVFINIMKNAIEASKGRGKIFVEIKETIDQQVTIDFVDEGCGIPQDRIHKLGEPFYSNKEKGTGLGLMICFKIVENHKGSIKIQSEVNCGTTITVTLPIKHEQLSQQLKTEAII